MKNLLSVATVAFVVASGVAFAQSTAAEAPEAVVYDAESAMAFLSTMAGGWSSASGDTAHGSNVPAVSFTPVAGGSAVIETIAEGTPGEMSSVFHMDGEDLLLTHYCLLQNAPVLRFEASDTPGLIKFVFQGGTNFDPAVDAHFHEGTFVIKDKDTIESTYVVHANGEPTPEGRSVLKRISAASN